MYIKLSDATYPVSEQDIRNANPNTSFSIPFQAPEEYAYVFPAPQPAVTNLQVAREIAPVLTSKGHYEQRWEVAPLFTEYVDENEVVHTVAEQEAEFLEAERLAKVPQAVSMRQARLALLGADLLDDITTAITALGQAAAIEWEYATEVQRNSPLIAMVQSNNALTDRQIDDLFVAASAL